MAVVRMGTWSLQRWAKDKPADPGMETRINRLS